MPQYAFRAKDKTGNIVEGTLPAMDAIHADTLVRRMGYTPLTVGPVETAQPVAVAAAVAAPSRPPLMDLTQEVAAPLDGQRPGYSLLDDGDDYASGQDEMTARMERLEPWQRGGPVEQAPAPTLSFNSMGAPINRTQTMPSGGEDATQTMTPPPYAGGKYRPMRGETGQVPYGEGAERQKPLARRFAEIMVYPILSGVVIRDLAPFYRQFATLINAGLPIFQSLSALEANTKNAKLKEIAREGQKQVQAGGRFSDVMEAYPWIFSPMQIELTRAAEHGGLLEQVLLNLADYLEHELEVRRLISRETMYPKIVIFVAIMILGWSGILGGNMAIVNLIVGKDYPMGAYFWNTIGMTLVILAFLLVPICIFRMFLFNKKGVREFYDTFKMYMPGLGKVVRMFALAKFCRTFASLYRAGFAMGSSLEIAGNACGNSLIRNAAFRVIPRVEKGELISTALVDSGYFPPMTIAMFSTGETTGNLDGMIDKVADFYEAEGKLKSHQAALLFGVGIFLIVAILVGNAIISQYGAYGRAATTVGNEGN